MNNCTPGKIPKYRKITYSDLQRNRTTQFFNKEIKSVTKSPPTEKRTTPDGSIGNFYQIFKEEITQSSSNCSKIWKRRDHLLTHFMMPKPEKDITKEVTDQYSLWIQMQNSSEKNTNKLIPTVYLKVYITLPSGISHRNTRVAQHKNIKAMHYIIEQRGKKPYDFLNWWKRHLTQPNTLSW